MNPVADDAKRVRDGDGAPWIIQQAVEFEVASIPAKSGRWNKGSAGESSHNRRFRGVDHSVRTNHVPTEFVVDDHTDELIRLHELG